MVYPIGKFTLFPLIKLFIRDVKGLENVPKDSPFIIASNHASYIDDLAVPVVIISHINKKVHFYTNNEFMKIPFLRAFLKWGGCIPVAVERKIDSRHVNGQAFKKAQYYLNNNGIIGIFPEGHRSVDGKLQQAKSGIAKLALSAKVPVLPIGLIGSNKILPKGKCFPRFKRLSIVIGKPLNFHHYYDMEDDKEAYSELTRKIMKEIGKLINQEYNY